MFYKIYYFLINLCLKCSYFIQYICITIFNFITLFYFVLSTHSNTKKQFSTPTSQKQPLSLKYLIAYSNAFSNPMHNNYLSLTLTICCFFRLHCLGKITYPNNITLYNSYKINK